MTRTIKVLAATLIGLACLVLRGRPVSQSAFRDVDFDTSLSWGGRFGRYFDSLPFLGLAVDVFHFSPNISPQSVHLEGCFLLGGCGSGQGGTGSFDITEPALSVDLMLRLPLIRTADAPRGLLQPYIALGRPLFLTTVTPRNTRLFRNHDSDTDLSFGYKAAGGLAVQVYANLVLFVEYRFTHVATDVNLRDAVVNKATLRTELNTHSALFGVSARW